MLKTRTVRTEEGHREVFCVDPSELKHGPNDPLALESSILWLEPFEKLAYVRSLTAENCRTRDGRLTPSGGGRVVGYSKLREDAEPNPKTGRFVRRIFYLKQSDFENAVSLSRVPKGGIDPRTLAPGFRGEPPGSRQTEAAEVPPKRHSDSGKLEENILDWLGEAAPRRMTKGRSQDDIDTMVAQEKLNDTALDGTQGGSIVLGELVSMDGEGNIELRKSKLAVGRMKECDIRFEQSNVSGLHCELLFENGKWYVKDLNSSNGVSINGVRIDPQDLKLLEPGDILSIAKQKYEVQYASVKPSGLQQAVAPLLSKLQWPKKKN